MTDYRRQFDLTGKVAVVTGAAGILGRRFVAGLTAHGAAVALIDLDQKSLDEAAHLAGGKTLPLACDITDEGMLRTAIERTEKELGAIDVLHNNAATKGNSLEAFFAPAEEYSRAAWRDIMAVNLDAMFFVAQQVGKRMVARRRGSIIQTASIYGMTGPDQRIYEGAQYMGRAINTPPVYSASKAGVIGLSRYLATLWGPSNVRVNALVPGGVESGQNPAFQKQYAQRVPLGRMAVADEIVGPLIFLASDASSYVTGQTLVVDGGFSAW